MTGVAELEAQLAFVEDTVSALDSALAAQQQHIMKLEQELELLRARLIEQGTRLDEITPPEAEPRRLTTEGENAFKTSTEKRS